MGSDGVDSWLNAVAPNSAMGLAVRDFDWSSTSLGAPSSWPDGLRSAVSICLSTHFPTLVVWGPDLVKIYNDGYSGILGEKHPAALGSPAQAVWPEIWDEIGPRFASVMDDGIPTWHHDERLVLERNGYPEECYFTYSYSALFDGDRIAGVLDLVVETTDKVVSQRRLECVADLNASLAGVAQVTDACVASTQALGRHRSEVGFADVFLCINDEIVLMASNRRDDVAPSSRIDLGAVIDGQEIVIGSAESAENPGSPPPPADLVALPIGASFRGLTGAVVLAPNPQRPFDDDYRGFTRVLADTIASALEGAYRRSVELGEYRHISDTLQAAMLMPASDLPTIAARYVPATSNLAVGGDWYDVVELEGTRRAVVVGDCVGHGLEAATVMAQLRAAARAMLLEGRRPAEVLEGLDAFAAHLDGAMGTTVVCAVYDRDARTLTHARAGHPPPLLSAAEGNRWLEDGGGPPLAALAEIDRTETCDPVGDEVLVLYSDGLIERRGEHLDIGLDRLSQAMVQLRGLPVQAIADGLLRDLQPETSRDDVVLVIKRL